MTQKPNETELVIFKKLLMDNSMEVETIAKLCLYLGIFTEEELSGKLQEDQADHLKN